MVAIFKGALVVLPVAWLGSVLHENLTVLATVPAEGAEKTGPVGVVAFSVLLLLAFDFAIFFSHYLQHKVPILWEFHKVHHSAEVLTPITVFRTSPVDLLGTGVAVILAESGMRALWVAAIGPAPDLLTILGMNAGIFLFYLFGYNLRHSHIWLAYPSWLSEILVSPAMHQIHHSSETRHLDKDMGFIFAWWDRLFSTLYIPQGKEEFRLGLYGKISNPFNATHEMLWKPFVWAWRRIKNNVRRLLALFLLCLIALPGLTRGGNAQDNYAPLSVHLEELTWTEVKRALQSGYTQVIIPTGGTEQNGPHMVLGKHNIVVRYTAGEIARRLGHTLVAPVVTYVPEGEIDPPFGHMNFAGTISISESTFQEILESTAESLLRHGFERVYLIGDSGGNQAPQKAAASNVNGDWWPSWQSSQPRVFHLLDYYLPKTNGQISWLEEQGFSPEQIGTHAGMRDTSEVMALRPEDIRSPEEAVMPDTIGAEDGGSDGERTLASPEIGRQMLKLKINAALAQIRSLSK